MAITQIRSIQIKDQAIEAAKIADNALIGGVQFAASVDVASKTFTGAATFSSPLVVADAVNIAEAVNKGQLDAAVAALGNAFNYIGTVAGGAASGTAYDLSTLAADEKDPGDYHKVATAGWFKDSAAGTPFYANAGDGVVWNTIGGVDIIDNTNSTVAGTTDFIAVTGSADTGFTVDIDTVFKTRVTDIETDVGDTSTLTTTATDLVGAINEVAAKGATDNFIRETPTGTIDGTNKAFTLSETPEAVTLQVFFNGLLQEPTDDYTLTGSTITMVEAPITGDKIRAIYFKA
jgi:hypothetical protein